jgi:hypothetical protein
MELKAQIIKHIILERDSIRVVMLNEMCASILSITELHLEALGNNPLLAHDMSLAILQTQGTALLQHLPSATLDEFTALYRTVNTIPDTTTATATNVRTWETIRLALVSVIFTSWTIYLKQQSDNELCLALRKKANDSLASDATTEAAILLDAEVPATQEKLRDLITREATKIVNQQCNALRNEIKNLKKSLNPKSSKKAGRGLPRKQGASQKKKNSGNKKASGPRDRDAPRSGIADQSGDESDGWTSVSSRNSRHRNLQRQPQPQHHQQQQQSRNRDRRAAGSGRGSQNDNGDNERRRSRSRSKIRNSDGGRRSNRSSAM